LSKRSPFEENILKIILQGDQPEFRITAGKKKIHPRCEWATIGWLLRNKLGSTNKQEKSMVKIEKVYVELSKTHE